MTNAAIYARKSTEQDDRAEDAKSVPRQVLGARAFITTKGWTLDDAQIGTKQVKGSDGTPVDRPIFRHVYEDDGVSGALFANRAEFQRLMRDAAAGAFQAVVFYDLDRFAPHWSRRAEAWKADLRAEPEVARLVLRRLIGPILLWEDAKEPDECRWDAPTTPTELLAGLPEVTRGWMSVLLMASPRGCARVGAPDTFIEGNIAA